MIAALEATRSTGVVQSSVVGDSPAMREVWSQVEPFAATDVSILLTGESGTGKDLIARAIHRLSERSRGPFIEVDCASIPESLIEAELFGHEKGAFTDAKEARKGKFELASGGTIFLDELGNLSPTVQAKLLRIVQERCFRRLGGETLVRADVRIVSATNVDLRAAMQREAFRSDLYYRLAELHVRLPALRERAGDLPLLFDHFVHHYAANFRREHPCVSPATRVALGRYGWPGNVRELKNVARASMLRAHDVIEPHHLPPYVLRLGSGSSECARDAGADAVPVVEALEAGGVERYGILIPWGTRAGGLDLKALHQQIRRDLDRHVLASLRKAGLNKRQMSRYLSLDYKVLLEKLKELGVA